MAWDTALTNNTRLALAKKEDKARVIEENKAEAEQKKAAERKAFTPSTIEKKSADLSTAGQRKRFVPSTAAKRQMEFHSSDGIVAYKKPGLGKWITDNILNGIGQFNRGIINTYDFARKTPERLFGDIYKKTDNSFKGKAKKAAIAAAVNAMPGGNEINNALKIMNSKPVDKFVDYMKNSTDELAQNAAITNDIKGGPWKDVGEKLSMITAAVPQAVLAMMSGGASMGASGASTLPSAANSGMGQTLMDAATQMAKNPMFQLSFIQSAGNSYDEAKEEGATDIEATASAVIGSLINAGVEVGGGLEAIPNKPRGILTWVQGMLDEGKEEVLQGVIEQSTRKAIYDHNRNFISNSDEKAVINPKRSSQEFAGGAIAGGILGAAQMGAGKAVEAYTDTVNTGQELKDAGVVQDVIDTGKASDAATAARRYADRLEQKQMAGKDLSDWNVGRQQQKNIKAIQSENDFAAAMSNIKPTEITAELYNDRGQELNGISTGKNVKASVNGSQSVPEAIKHEWSHMFKTLDPTAYGEYENSVIEAAREANSEAVNKRMDFLMNEYGYNEEVAREEIAAELTGGFNTTAIQQMAEGNTTLVEKIAVAAQRAKAHIKAAFGNGKYTSSTGLQMTFSQLNQAEKQYIDGLNKARNNQAQTAEVRYSPIEYDGDGNAYVRIDEDILEGVPKDEWAKTVRNVLREKFSNGIEYNGENVAVSRKSRNEFTESKYTKNLFENTKSNKFRMANNLDEIINIQNDVDTENPNHIRKDDIVGFERGNARVAIGDNEFTAEVLIANKKDGTRQFYDIINLKPTKIQQLSQSGRINDVNTEDADSAVSNNSIPGNDENVKYSVKESTDQTGFSSKSLASQLISEYGAKIKKSEAATDIDEIRRILASDITEGVPSDAASNTAWKLSERLADKIADSINIVDNDMYDTYVDLRRYLRTTPIKYYDDYKSETGQFENYNELRKKSFGLLRLSNNGVGIDSVYKELSGMYPNFFNEETEATPAAQLEQILNVLEATSKKENTLSKADYNKAVDEIASRVFSGAVNDAVNGRTEPTDNMRSDTEKNENYGANAGEMTTTIRSAVRPYGAGDIDYNTLASDADTRARVNELMEANGVKSPSELTEDTISRERSKKDRNVFRGKETVHDVMSRAYTAVIDDMHPFWNYNKAYETVTGNVNYGRNNPYKLAINSKDASSRSAYIVTDKMVDYDNNVVGEGLIGTITKNGINKANYKDFNNYLVARHAFEWLDPDNHGAYKRVYEELELNDMGVVASMITDFERKNPEFKQAADKIYEWQRQLMKTWLVDTGVITLEQYNKFTEMYPSYVPFFREENISVGGGKDGFANQNSPIKEAIGSQRRILEPIENIMYNTASYVNHATKHGVMQSAVRLYDMLENDSENNVLRQFWEEVEPTDLDEKKPQYFKLKGQEAADIQDATDEGQGSIHQTLQDQMNIQDGNVVTIIDDGKKRYFRVYDKDFLTLLDNAKAGKFDGVLGVFASFSRVRAALITSWNPAFSLASNPIRDFGTLMLNSTDKNKVKIAGEAVKAYADIFKNSDAYQSYLSMGGQYSSVTTEGMDALKMAMRKLQGNDPNLARRFFKQFPKLFDGYQTISDAIEASPRMAEFKTTLDKGYDYHEAFYRAKDVTTNFSRGGRISKELNAVSNFFNASIQGVDKYFRQAKNNPASFATGIACLTAAELLAWAWNTAGDDDDKDEAYENLSNYTKNNFYNFYIGKGKFVSIPKARESAVLSTTISAALNEFVNKQEDRFKDYFSDYVLSQFIPDGSIVGVSTYVDLSSNKDYMGRPIVPSNLENLPDELQYDDSTSYLAKWLGGILKQSPKRIDHIINSDTGVFGKINKTYFTPSGRQDKATMLTFGVNSTYRKDSLFSTDQVNMFYDNKDKADKQADGYPNSDNGYLSSRFAQSSKVLSVLNDMYKEDRNSDAGREIRRAYVNYAKDSKDNPSGLTDEVYNNIKNLYDTDKKVLSLPAVSREIKAKINKEDKGFTFTDAQSLLNYQKDLNMSVDEAYRKLLSDVKYGAMTNSEKADALDKAKSGAVKSVKQFYIENNGVGRMFDEEKVSDITYPDEKAVTQSTEKLKYQGEINSKLQSVSDAVAAAVPDKARDYSLQSLQINNIQSVSLDGKNYSISNELKSKLSEAANEEYYSNLGRLMDNEINVEDVVGYTSKGEARTSEQADGSKVSLTGKLYNDDGTPRFDELVTAKIIYKAKEKAKESAINKYASEISKENESQPQTFTPRTTVNTSKATSSEIRFTSKRKSTLSRGKRTRTASKGGRRRFKSVKSAMGKKSSLTKTALPNTLNPRLMKKAADLIKNPLTI